MKLPRRTVLQLATGACALPALSRSAWAQTYPTRAVRIVTTFPAGGTSDLLTRPLAQWLQERLGSSFVIENRPGAGGTIGTEAVVRAVPDGYTLLLIAGAHMVNATLYQRLSHQICGYQIRISRPRACAYRKSTRSPRRRSQAMWVEFPRRGFSRPASWPARGTHARALTRRPELSSTVARSTRATAGHRSTGPDMAL